MRNNHVFDPIKTSRTIFLQKVNVSSQLMYVYIFWIVLFAYSSHSTEIRIIENKSLKATLVKYNCDRK